MSPPPPPPPPVPGAPAAPLAQMTSSVPASPPAGTTKAPDHAGGLDHNDELMAAIRNGINLKPTKTNDRSTPGFIKRANGPLDANGAPEQQDDASAHDKPCSIDEMKDALQAELRNTLKRKIKQHDPADDDGRKNEEIERAIEHTRNEVQLKLNGPSSTGPTGSTVPKVDNPLKSLVDMVDKERAVPVAGPTLPPIVPAVVKQSSPVPVPKAHVTITPAPGLKTQPLPSGSAPAKKVSTTQGPVENGNGAKINVNTTPWMSSASASVRNGAVSPSGVVTSNGTILKSPVPSGKLPSNTKATSGPASPAVATTVAPKLNASQTVKKLPSPVPNGTAVSVVAPSYGGTVRSSPATKPGTYYNTLPRTFGASTRTVANVTAASEKASVSPTATPPVFNSTVKMTIGSFGAGTKPSTNGGSGPVVRNGVPSKIEPLSIEIASCGGSAGSSTNGTASPSTPKELLSPQVRSGTASIRPSQIRTLTKAGSVVSHTDIVETPRPIAKLPVTLIEPAPVLTAAAAASPPPASPRTVPVTPPKERTALFEKASSGAKEPPKSPLNRWADSTSVSGGTARKLLLSHGRPNFTIKRSNSRQGFDVDLPDGRSDTVKPVFRILTDLEKMETEQAHRERAGGDQRQPNGAQQQYVSFAKDLSNAPNNHPDVAVVTKTVIKPNAPTDPFLATLKDIKIDIGGMKVVNAKDA